MTRPHVFFILLSLIVLIKSARTQLSFKCTEEVSRHPHFDNCQKFYLCQNSKVYIDTCPGGQKFDAPSNQCLDTNRAICARRPTTVDAEEDPVFTCPSEKGNFFHESLCQEYYECSSWIPRRRTCPQGTLFDQHARACTKEAEVDCGIRQWRDGAVTKLGFRCTEEMSRHPHYEQCTRFYLCQNGKVFIDSCPSGSRFDAPSRKCVDKTTAVCAQRPTVPPTGTTEMIVEEETSTAVAPFACSTRNGNFTHETQCDRYYMCFNFLPYDKTCPTGTLFDQRKGDCVEEALADCGGTVLPDEAATRLGVKCGSETSRHPNLLMCDRYYVCRDGQTYTASCPQGQLFDEPSRECLHGARAICAGISTTTEEQYYTTYVYETTRAEEKLESTTYEYETTRAEEEDETTEASFRCSILQGKIFHETRCEDYYECLNWLPYPRTCPSGTLFDQHNKSCLPEVQTDCGHRIRPDGASTQSPWTTKTLRFVCRQQNGIFFHEELCEMYYECFNWLPYDHRCPQDMLMDEHSRMCKPEIRANCGTRRRPDGASPEEPETTEALTWETTRSEETTTTTTITTEPPVTTVDIKTTTSAPSTTTETTTSQLQTTRRTTTTESGDDSGEFVDLECPEPDGSFPHPKNRHWYIVCIGNFPYFMKCPADLVFDPVKRVCVWEP